MNWKLVLQLSLFGLVMAVATVFWIPSTVEPAFWLVIFGFSAYLIAPRTVGPSGMMLVIGPVIGVVSGVVIGLFVLLAAKLIKVRPSRKAPFPGTTPYG
ncbi:MAG: hypothetical protein EXR92_02685 [Gemmatimonadetes bacterium]|nr:hypothetical protein [Gemmatimonadota bacterium]